MNAADDAAKASQGTAKGEYEGKDHGYVMTQCANHIRTGQGALDDQAGTGFLDEDPEAHEHGYSDQQDEYLEPGIVQAEHGKCRGVQGSRGLVGNGYRTPEKCHQFLDHIGEAEGEQQFRHMAVLVNAAKAIAFNQGAHGADGNRGEEQRHPEAGSQAKGIGEIGTQHIEAGMSKVQDTHHPEDQGQAAGHHEQQRTVEHAIEYRISDGFEHGETNPGLFF